MPVNNGYNLVAENPHSTVVTEYTPDKKRATHYQSEVECQRHWTGRTNRASEVCGQMILAEFFNWSSEVIRGDMGEKIKILSRRN